MSDNLIVAGFINPGKFHIKQLLEQVSLSLEISEDRIDRIECWAHQIWVNIEGFGATLLSYRRLPIWKELIVEAINNCKDLETLEELKRIVWIEAKKYPQYYDDQTLNTIMIAIEKRVSYLKPILARQKAVISWLYTWRRFLTYSDNPDFLKQLGAQIKEQSQKFADYPDVIEAIEGFWNQRCQQIAVSRAIPQ